MQIPVAKRLKKLPDSYVFGQIAQAKAAARKAGRTIIDFGIGDPNFGAPNQMIESIAEALRDRSTHTYPDTEGHPQYREAWAKLYEREWGVQLDPDTEIHHLIGGKEGIAHAPLPFVDPGDRVICPDPAYPVYDEGTIIAGGVPYYLALLEENGFLPDFESVPDEIAKFAKILWINSPNNPTGAVADLAYFQRLVEWAKRHEVMVFSDATYSHLNGSVQPTPSFLQASGARDIGVEFHSISKTYSFTGSRCAIVVGNPEIIKGIHRIKATIDSGGPDFIQMGVAAHLLGCDEYIADLNVEYTQRREALQEMLNGLGFNSNDSDATFYVWSKNPVGSEDSEAFAYRLIKETGVVCVPGKGLGRENGEGYTRWSVACADVSDIEQAQPVIATFLKKVA